MWILEPEREWLKERSPSQESALTSVRLSWLHHVSVGFPIPKQAHKKRCPYCWSWVFSAGFTGSRVSFTLSSFPAPSLCQTQKPGCIFWVDEGAWIIVYSPSTFRRTENWLPHSRHTVKWVRTGANAGWNSVLVLIGNGAHSYWIPEVRVRDVTVFWETHEEWW